MKIKLMAILPLLVVVLAGCEEMSRAPKAFVEGEVVWVSGILNSLETSPEFDGLVSYSNETVRFGRNFVFGVQTSDGVYTIQIDPTDKGGSTGPQTIYNLAATLKVGMKVRFPTKVYGGRSSNDAIMGFSKSKIGMLDPDDVELLTE